MRLLLVEDDQLLGDGIRAGLRLQGWTADWVRDGEAGRQALEHDRFDAVILDLGLPRLDGIEVLKGLRAAGNDVPVLILTARDAVSDRIAGLDAGADDYLTKPFDLDELAARLRALIRRHAGHAEPVLRVGDLELNPAARSVARAGTAVDLTAREFGLLEALVQAGGRPLTRQRLEEVLYGWDDSAEGNVLEVHVHNIRKKLGKTLIVTVRGVGYRCATETELSQGGGA
ncbi:MAG: response regulator [Gammaproteobacteria bacterium]